MRFGPARITDVFTDLLNHPEVTELAELGGSVGVMAVHGGVETATESIAHRVAKRTGASIYTVTQSERLRWHVPSTEYDPDKSTALATFLAHVRVVVSIHGFGREHLPRTALVGGGNEGLVSETHRAMRRRTSLNILTGPDIPVGLRGLHPANPVNLPEHKGVQLELSHSCRHHPHVDGVVDAIVDVVTSNL